MNNGWLSAFLSLMMCSCLSAAIVSQKIHLKFNPEVGKTYYYSYTTKLDKTTFGKTTHENLQGTISMEILEKLQGEYRTKIQIDLESSNMSQMVFDRMKQQNKDPRLITISEAYNWDIHSAYNLCFPDYRIQIGEEWTGSASFHIGDLSSLEQPEVDVLFKLVKEEQMEGESCFTIICQPADKVIEVPFQLGSLGIKCDEERERNHDFLEKTSSDHRHSESRDSRFYAQGFIHTK